MLKWLKENGCYVEPDRYDSLTNNAAREGHLEVLKWLHTNGCPLNAYAAACESGAKCLEILKWLKENGCIWDNRAHIVAAKEGNMEALNWLSENGQNESIFRAAVSGGSLEIVQWVSQKIEIKSKLKYCALAASRGHLEVLKWLREKEFPWDKYLLQSALMADGNRISNLPREVILMC